MRVDGRKLDRKVLEHLRIAACRRVRQGECPSAVIKSLGLNRTTIYDWLERERRGGRRGLRLRKSPGRERFLSLGEQQRLKRWIIGKDPRAFGYEQATWTRQIISELLLKQFGVSMSVTGVGKLLAYTGLTPQKPLRRAYERDEQAIEEWKTSRWPEVRKRAKRRGAVIMFLDEAGIKSDSPLGSTWGKRGKTPIVRTSGQRQKVNAVSAVSSTGAFRYATYSGKLDTEFFVAILKLLIKRMRRPIFFVLDGHPVHRAGGVKKFIASMKGQVELHFLPPYAPDLNPDEFVWNHIKKHGLSKKPLRRNESLQKRVEQDLRNLENNPKLLRSFFKAKSVGYLSA